MLRAAIGFFIVGLLCFALGAGNIGVISMEVGKTLLWVFLILAIISFVLSIFTGRGTGIHLTILLLLGTGAMFSANDQDLLVMHEGQGQRL